jgi:hypothetical protein
LEFLIKSGLNQFFIAPLAVKEIVTFGIATFQLTLKLKSIKDILEFDKGQIRFQLRYFSIVQIFLISLQSKELLIFPKLSVFFILYSIFHTFSLVPIQAT